MSDKTQTPAATEVTTGVVFESGEAGIRRMRFCNSFGERWLQPEPIDWVQFAMNHEGSPMRTDSHEWSRSLSH